MYANTPIYAARKIYLEIEHRIPRPFEDSPFQFTIREVLHGNTIPKSYSYEGFRKFSRDRELVIRSMKKADTGKKAASETKEKKETKKKNDTKKKKKKKEKKAEAAESESRGPVMIDLTVENKEKKEKKKKKKEKKADQDKLKQKWLKAQQKVKELAKQMSEAQHKANDLFYEWSKFDFE